MNPRHVIALSTLFVILCYWVMTLFVFNADSSTQGAITPLPPDGIIATVLFSLLGILALVFLPKKEVVKENETSQKPFHDVISSLIFSPAPFQTKLQKALEHSSESLHIQDLFVMHYHGESLKLLHKSSSLALAESIALSDSRPHSPLEKELLSFFGKKAEMHNAPFSLEGKTYTLVLISLKAEHLLKPSGVLGALLPSKLDSKTTLEALHFLAQNLAFVLSLNDKKVSILRANERQMEQISDEDPRFKIYSNLKLRQLILYEMKRVQRYKTDLSLLLFGIDHYENLCNILSPEKGVAIQKELVNLIKHSLRDTDILASWDENIFAILLPDLPFQSANALSKKLASLIEKKRFEEAGKITCSFGITTFITPEDTIETFRRRAESALQKARNEGGNKTEIKLLVSTNHVPS